MSDVKTYRGRGLEELIPQIRADLGDDAVILRQRSALEGGVGGFFARKFVEVDAMAPAASIDVRDDEPAEPDAPPAPAPAPVAEPTFAEHLAQMEQTLPPAPEVRPAVDARVASAPAPGLDDLFPETGTNKDRLAALFQQGLQDRPAPEPLVEQLHAAAERAQVIEEGSDPTSAQGSGPTTEHDLVPEPFEPTPGVPVATVADDAPADPQVIVLGDSPPQALELLKDPAHRQAVVSLTARGLSPELATDLVAEVVHHVMPLVEDPEPRLEDLLRGAIGARIPVAHPRRGAGGRVVAFAGPSGSGKTRCVAGLAVAYARRSPLPVACVAFRPDDGGAELQRLLAPVGVPVHVEDDAERAEQLLRELRQEALVLVDTPGVSPLAEAELRVLGAELRTIGVDELHLTAPAPFGPEALSELVHGAQELRPEALVLTHADVTSRLGTVIELAIQAQLPLSYVGRGSSLQAGLRPASAEELALALVP